MRLGATRIKSGGESSVWDSHDIRFVTGGVTVDPATVPRRNKETGAPDPDGFRLIYQGDVLGRISATGFYGPYNTAAADGRAVARCLAAGTYNLDSGFVEATEPQGGNGISIGAVDRARVLRKRMSIQYTDAQLNQIKTDLLANGALITFTEATGNPGFPVRLVDLAPSALTLTIGQVYDIMPVWTPANAANKHGIFTTSNPAAVTVPYENTHRGAVGHITGISAGTATITFTSADGGFTATAAVTVA